jgi:hypothetical protein
VSGLTSDAQTISIEWKSDAVNLTKKFPRGVATASSEEGDDEGFDGDEGSFFHFFTEQFDPNSVSRLVGSSSRHRSHRSARTCICVYPT